MELQEEYKKCLMDNLDYMADNIETATMPKLLNFLVMDAVLTQIAVNEIESKLATSTPYKALTDLVIMLTKRPARDFPKLINALNKSGNEHIAEKLLETATWYTATTKGDTTVKVDTTTKVASSKSEPLAADVNYDESEIDVTDFEVVELLEKDFLLCKNWKKLCKALKFEAGTINDLEKLHNANSGMNEVITKVMENWKGTAGAAANVSTLSQVLRRINCVSCAEKVEKFAAGSK